MAYVSQYPPAQNDTYVKATSKYSTNFWPYFATDPLLSLIGSWSDNSWLSGASGGINQRFHIDLGSAKAITKIYYENAHDSGAYSDCGAKAFTLWGSNEAAAFAELTYGTDTNWTQIGGALQFDQHAAANSADPKYITVANTTPYRYYAIKIATNWGNSAYIGLRRIELQLVPSGGAFLAFM